MLKFKAVVILFSFFVGSISTKAKEFQIFVNNIESEVDPEYCKVEIKFQNTSQHHAIVDIDFEVLKDSDTSSTILIEILKKNEHGDYVHMFKSAEHNLCKLLSNPKEEPLLLVMFDGLKHHGNIVDQCPYKKGHFNIKDYKLDPTKLPDVSFEGDFRADVEIFFQENGKAKQLLKIMGFISLREI